MSKATEIIGRTFIRTLKTVSPFAFAGSLMLAGVELYPGASLHEALATVLLWTVLISAIPTIWIGIGWLFSTILDLFQHEEKS